MDLQGAHALVTGASKGIGAAIARELAGSGPRASLEALLTIPLSGHLRHKHTRRRNQRMHTRSLGIGQAQPPRHPAGQPRAAKTFPFQQAFEYALAGRGIGQARLHLAAGEDLERRRIDVLGEISGSQGIGDGAERRLVALDGATPATTGMLALGDPKLTTREFLARADASPLPRDPRWRAAATPLPEARREVRSVAPPTAMVLLGPEARLTTFLDEAGDQAVLHLATHALNDPLDGRRSTLLLASDRPEDGPASLTAAACETLSLRTDLAVLSACRSGLGHAVLGEGSFGLPRSLLVAGTRSVVSSLWDVEDRAARRFMEEFYAGLRAGRARDIALRDASATLAASGAPPRDWAAFVLTGVGHEPVSAVAGTDVASWNRLEIWFGLGAAIVLVGVVLLTRLRRRRRN